MPEPDQLKPTDKDPAEGGSPGGDRGAPPASDPEQSHLGEAGDPAEG